MKLPLVFTIPRFAQKNAQVDYLYTDVFNYFRVLLSIWLITIIKFKSNK